MMDVLERFRMLGIIPVVKIDDAKDAEPLAKALTEGGLPVAEVTFRTEAAEEAILRMSRAYPEMLVGAGTVLTTEQVDRAVAAGAKFIVSPGLNPKVVKHCIEKGVPITPGTSGPSEIEQALELGLDVVKFFPAEASGGIAKIKAMAAPYTKVRFMPTGGVNAKNLISYLDFPKVIACGGSWMVSDVLINEGRFDEIKRLTEEAVNSMLGFEVARIGIHGGEEAETMADSFERMFGFVKKSEKDSVFAGSGIELMKEAIPEVLGQIAVRTNYFERAKYHMGLRGIAFDETTLKTDEKGNPVSICLKETFGGFQIRLVQK